MNERDSAAVDTLIRETAARIVLPRFRNLGETDIQEKAPGDFVTVADVEAEAALTKGLIAIKPGSLVVGEEGVAQQKQDLSLLGSDGVVWLLDPIDGTVNFVEGIARFAMMVAMVEGGEIVAGWIYDPVAGWMARTERGAGAWRNGERLSVRRAGERPAEPSLANHQLMRRIETGKVPADFKGFTYRCAGQEYTALASGAADYLLYTRLMPWDHAAGILLHREAGGIGKLVDDRPYSVRVTSGRLLMAPDIDSWTSVNATLRK